MPPVIIVALVKSKVKHAHGYTSLGWLSGSVGEGWSAAEGVGLGWLPRRGTRKGAEARKSVIRGTVQSSKVNCSISTFKMVAILASNGSSKAASIFSSCK